MDAACETCETALVRSAGDPPHDIDVVRTIDALQHRVASGRMRYIRGDVPLEDMVALAESDLKYTIVSYLECEDCGATRFWGLCIRGAPIYRVAEAGAPAKHPWSDVPARELWA